MRPLFRHWADHPADPQGQPARAEASPMMMPAPRPRGTRQALAGREFAIGRVARPTPFAIAWRWRYEALLAVVASTGSYFLADATGWMGACIVIAVTAALVILVPPLRAGAAVFA